MQEVGIKALKDNLSQYIGLVRKGEIVVVKDRNEVVAEIRRPSNNNTENLYIQEAILKGSVLPEKAKKTNIDSIVKKYAKYRLDDIKPQEIYASLKDK
jgi:antitoxin (DNA-binding transcriptional repressor) of toxin-antitoxin stability system